MSVYELSINPGPAEKGAERIVKSFESIKAAAGRMEGGVTASANKMLAAFRQLSNIRTVSREAISQLQALSSALGSFRGPSKAAVDNTSRFLTFLSQMGRIALPSGARMAQFLASISGYRGPTATAGRNTEALLRALSRFTPPAGVGGRINSLLASLSAYRGPHASAGRNTLALLNALSSFRGSPRNISAAIHAFDALARSIAGASAAMGAFRRASGGPIRVPTGAGPGGFNPRNYARDLGFLNTAIFRTTTAFQTLGGVLAARTIITASNDLIKIQAQLEAATGSVQQARVQWGFLQDRALKMGLELRNLSRSYGFFLGSIKGTSVTFAEAQTIFEGFTTAARALQLSTSDVDGVFRALGQIMSKGKLQAEELRGQLGDRLPGAFVRFATALDMTKPGQLDEALKKGAISGDKLKKAIISVAQSLQVEFAVGAEKMSKTVDAAFNRLQNSFVQAAAGLGRSGLNEGIINITDALRTFLDSAALASMLQGLGAAFKFLGDNINGVVYILGTLAIAASLKWLAGAVKLGAALGVLRTVMLELSIAQAAVAMGMGRLTVAGVLLQRTFTALWAVIRAHPFIFIAGAITTLVALMGQLRNANDENRKAAEAMSGTMADAENIEQAFAEKVLNTAGNLDIQTQALRNNTIAQIENARAKLGNVEFNVHRGRRLTTRGIESYTRVNGVNTTGNIQEVLDRVAPGGSYKPASNAAEFRNRMAIMGQLGMMSTLNPDQYKGWSELHKTIRADVNQAISYSKVKGNKLGFDAAGIAGQDFGDYNRAIMPPGISGDVEAKDKNKKRSSEADQYENDIRSALEALRDLRREAASARSEMEAYLKSGSDVVEAQSRAAAEQRVDNIMDSFKDPATASRGLVDLNQRLKEQASIFDQLTPAARAARQELIDFYAVEERKKIEAQAGADAAKRIQDLKFENEQQKDLVKSTAEGGRFLQEMTVELEAHKILRLASAEDQERLLPELKEQLRIQQDITRQLSLAQEYNRANLESRNMTDTVALYSGGYRQDEIDYYRQLIEYRNELKNDGYTNKEINDAVSLRAALLNQKDAYDRIQEEYEESRQLGQDMADAFVDGFQRAIESGENFFKSLKNIFSDLKKIILNFVLYDPLRKWLSEVFTFSGSPGAEQAPMTRSAMSGGGSASVGGGIGGLITGFSTLLAGSGGVPSVFSGGISETGALGSEDYSQDVRKTLTDPITSAIYESSDIYVKALRKEVGEPLVALPQKTSGPSYFSKLGRIFDWKANSKAIGDVFKGGMGKLSETMGPAMQALGSAFAAFQMGDAIGKGVGKALGLGGKGQSVMGGVLGGAAAGFSLGGPVGAAVGAVAGGLLGLFTGGQEKKREYPVAWGNVVIDEFGIARPGSTGTASSGTKQMGETAAALGARLFNQIAIEIGATLKAGNYGVFGQAAFSKPGEDEVSPFYSLTGQMNGIHPAGKQGVDWIKGTETEIQAWAILQQFRKGNITDLAPTMKTIFTNTQAKTMEDLQADIGVGKSFDEFIRSSYALPEVTSTIMDLEEGFKKLSRQAKLLGLNENALAAARARLLNNIKSEFNFSVQQGILEITDPRMAAYNALVREYRETVDEAIAVGGDLAEVERLYGLKRAELLKTTSEGAFNSIRESARALLTELTASQNSPLAGGTILGNAAALYGGLRTELLSGNTQNADQLSSYAQNYLQAAYQQYGSSTAYFDIFRQVTEFLQDMETYTGGATGGEPESGDIPELPLLEDLVNEITERNNELALLTQAQTDAVVDLGTAQLGVQEQILDAIIGRNLETSGGGETTSIAGGWGTIRQTIGLV